MTTNSAFQKTAKGVLYTQEDANTLDHERLREYDFHRGADNKGDLRRNPSCPMQ